MSISQLNGQQRLRANMAAAALRHTAASQAAEPSLLTRQPDAVSISDQGRALASGQSTDAGAAAAREERVNALKAAVASGTYRVDSRTLANTLVKNYAQ